MSQSRGMETDLIEKTVEKRNKILVETDERVKEILKTAEAEKARINAETDRQILQLMASELKTVRERIVGRTELEGRKALMTARENVITKVYDQVESKLKEIAEGQSKDHDYESVLKKLVTESVSAIGGKEFVISANKVDMKHMKKIKIDIESSTIKLEDNAIDILGGVIVKNPSGDKIYYNSLEGRLERAKRTLKAEVAKTLGVI